MVKVIGHRGVGALAPENTLPSYRLAASLGGYYGVECDIHETLDGRFILLHDDSLCDTTDARSVLPHRARSDGEIYAEDCTLEEIRTLLIKDRDKPPRYRNAAAYGEVRVPLLEEYLKLCVQCSLVPVIEVKKLANAPAFLSVLDSFSVRYSCIILSFDREAIRQLVKEDSRLNIELLFTFNHVLTERDVEDILSLGCRGADVHYATVTPQSTALLRAKGLEINAWESRPGVTREETLRVYNSDIDYITSDKPIE